MNFIEKIIEQDSPPIVKTRFPPEPNGNLHLGHAKSVWLNFETAKKYGGTCNLRFDDTNPEKETVEYINAIIRDVEWLGYIPDKILYASDYYPKLYQLAKSLIEKGFAYVDDTDYEEIKKQRMDSIESAFRNRSIAENLQLFEEMKAGKYPNGSKVLRAKIDPAHPNAIMRDPLMYRVKHCSHHRTGDQWCIYPLYDWAHPLSDYFEGITHSLCTLEFEIHRELYNWFLDALDLPEPKPRQIEFAGVDIEGVTLSKRVLTAEIAEGRYTGWDDPEIPTIAGLRRKGYTPTAIKEFCTRVGITKTIATVERGLLESCLRDDLENTAKRVMVVTDPLLLEITNYPDDKTEYFTIENHPAKTEYGNRKLEFTKKVYIEREDFMENPPKKYFRLRPGEEVRLRGAYVIRCNKVIKEGDKITKLECTIDPDTHGGEVTNRKIRGTIHWVSNPIRIMNNTGAEYLAERSLESAKCGERFQFMRKGYYVRDNVEDKRLVFNLSVGLRDSWAKKI